MPLPLSLAIAYRQIGGTKSHAVVQTERAIRIGPAEAPLVNVDLQPTLPVLMPVAVPGVAHYLRLADATLIPLPPEHEGSRHRLVAWQLPRVQPGGAGTPLRLTLDAGDAYIAVVGSSVDSPAIARFIHLRDYFNAERLADALSTEIQTLHPHQTANATLLVIEARQGARG